MKKLRIISLLLAVVLTVSLAACGNQRSEESNKEGQQDSISQGSKYNFQLAFSAADSSPAGITAKKVKELMEEKSDGKITVDIYPDAQLGGDRELIESCQAGNLAMISLTTAPMVNFIPELAVFDMPVALSDLDVAQKVLSGSFRDKISEKYEEAGFKLLMMAPDSYREMSSNVPVKKIEDFDGIKIRTMENKYHMAFWKALGANPSPLAFSELYIGLQQGLVDAQENPYATLIASKLYEQQKYIINTHHIMFLSTTVMNKELYDSIPSEYQAIVDEVFAEADQYAFKVGKEEADKALKQIEDAGLEVIDLSQEVVKKMQEVAEPVYDMIREDIGANLVDSLLNELEAAQK